MSKIIFSTSQAPAAVGPYNQAAQAVGSMVYLSGQIGLDPVTGELVQPFEAQVRQAFLNMKAVVHAAQAQLSDIVKLTLFLTDMTQFAIVNSIMIEIMPEPFCARSTIGVASLPKNAQFEVEAIVAKTV